MSGPNDHVDVVAVIDDLARRSETSLVIVSVSILEDWVEEALKTRFRTLTSDVEHRIFQGYGPLSSFAGKIDIAYALMLFERETYNDLRALKDIRNAFAHTTNFIHFKSPELQPTFQRLSGWTPTSDPETLFRERLNACVESFKQVLDVGRLVRALMEHKPKQVDVRNTIAGGAMLDEPPTSDDKSP